MLSWMSITTLRDGEEGAMVVIVEGSPEDCVLVYQKCKQELEIARQQGNDLGVCTGYEAVKLPNDFEHLGDQMVLEVIHPHEVDEVRRDLELSKIYNIPFMPLEHEWE